jgi:DNA repair exonuclease SbcCD ATPase subunit
LSVLEFDSVSFRNFFSYGKKLQEIKFEPGINIIQGRDYDKDRSNGSGKSSVTRTIPFALFGKTHKNAIKKEQIINWKNRRNCEVYLNVRKDDTLYTFFRGLRPDVLKVYENGRELPAPSDIRTYQKTIESEILGFDFQSFMSLIYTNINDITPILKLDRIKKRQFLDPIFNLEYYSKLILKGNDKIKSTNDKISSLKMSMEVSSKMIADLEQQNISLRIKLSNILSSEKELSVEKDELNRLIKVKGEIHIDEIEKKRDYYKENIDILWKNIVEKTEQLQQENVTLESKRKEIVSERHKLDISLTKAKTNLENKKSTKKGLEGKDACPTCGTEIISGRVLEKIQLDCQKYQEEIKELDSKKQGIEKILQEIESIQKKENEQRKIQKKELESLQKELNKLNDEFKELNKQREEIKLFDDQIQEKENEIKILEERISHEIKARNDFEQMEKDNNKKIEELKEKNKDVKIKSNRMSGILDYLEYMKVLCKDENVKQYAIATHIPYVNERTNKYLSEGGMGFYIKFDNFLEADIKGPGIYGCTYDNLSGGEMRSVDLAMQFAFLDVARRQAACFPDILIMDELLDSSIDSAGLTDIFGIIKAKQVEDKSKVFIISHRQEITDVEADNVYLIEKSNGYSTVTKL